MPPREEGGHVWGEEAEQPEGREAAGWPRGTVQRTDTPQRPAVSGREAQCGVGAPLLLPPVLQAAICGSICDLKSTCRITTRPPPGHAAHTGGCVGWLAQGASWTHALGTMPWLPGPSRWRCCAWWASTMSAGPQARRPRPPPLRGRHSCPHRTLRLCMGGLPRHAFDFNLQAGIMALRFAAPRQAGSAAGGSACHSACVCASAGADAFWLTTNQPKDLKRSANKRALRRAPSCRTTTNEPAGDALNLCRSGASDTAQTFGSSRLLGLLSRRARATVRA